MVALLTFVALSVLHTLLVVPVYMAANGKTAHFLVGFTRPVRPPCPHQGETADQVSDAECIVRLTLDQKQVDSFWGNRRIQIAALSLSMAYLAFTSAFGAIIGLVVLRQAKGS